MRNPDKPHNPHDALFKEVFGRPVVAAEFFQGVLPASLADEIDWQTLKREGGSFIDKEFRASATAGILESILYYVVKEGLEPLFDEMRRSLRTTQGSKVEERTMTKFAQKFLDRGEINGLQEAVLEGLKARFGEPPKELRERVQSVEAPEALKKLIRAAWQSPSLDEFKNYL